MSCEHISYEHMSDFEINNHVAFALGYLVKTEIEDGLCGFTKEYHEKYPNTIWAAKTDERGEQREAWEQMNFCSSPEEAWPIINEHRIAIMPDYDSWKAGSLPPKMTVGWANFIRGQANPLRAAMIVFLKMQGGE